MQTRMKSTFQNIFKKVYSIIVTDYMVNMTLNENL